MVTSESNLMRSAMNFFDCFLEDFRDEKFMESISDLDVRAQLEGVFFFSCIWSLGATMDTNGRPKFSILFRALLEREFPQPVIDMFEIPYEIPKPEKPYIFAIPPGETVFDFRFIKEVEIVNCLDVVSNDVVLG